jgi:uncharacterized repeat protein (TIGR01451 family)
VTEAPAPPSLAIIKTDDPAVIAGAGPDPVAPGMKLTYKIRVTNTSSTRADDVTVVDGTQGLEAASIVATQVVVNGTVGNGNGCSVAAPEVRCRIRTLNPGGTLTITVTGTVIAPAGTRLVNTATATGNIKNTGVTATATEQTTVKPAVDLTITKAGAPDPVCAGSWPSGTPDVCIGGLRYTFVVGNSGITSATGVVVRDPLPAGTTYDSMTNVGTADFTCSVDAANVLTCTDPSIGPETTETFTIVLVAPSTTGPLPNTVTVDPANAIFEADETNNTASATVQVVTGVDLTVVKLDEPVAASDPLLNPPGTLVPTYPSPAQGVDPVATNGTVVYTIYVDNLGTQSTANVRVEDTLPAGTRFLSATSDSGFTCSHDGSALGGVVTCVGGSLLGTLAEFYDPAGPAMPQGNQYATIVIKALATNNVQPTMHNEVRVDPQNAIPEANETNNIATQDTVVATGGAGENAFNQLTVGKTQTSPAGGAAVATNGVARFNLHVSNDGTDPVSAIVVKDFLPTGSRFISASDTDAGPGTADAFFCTHDGSATGGVVTCTGGALSGTLNTIPEASGGGTVPTSRDVTVTIFAPNTPGDYPNVAKVDPDNTIPEGNEFDNQSSITVRVRTTGDGGQNAFHQLTITKTSTPTVATSSVITYTLVVSNTGTDPAFGVALRDVLPAGTGFISALDTISGPNAFSCSESAGVVTCTGATLSGTAVTASSAPTTRTVTIKAFAPTQPGTVDEHGVRRPEQHRPRGRRDRQPCHSIDAGHGRCGLHRPPGDEVRHRSAAVRRQPRPAEPAGDLHHHRQQRGHGPRLPGRPPRRAPGRLDLRVRCRRHRWRRGVPLLRERGRRDLHRRGARRQPRPGADRTHHPYGPGHHPAASAARPRDHQPGVHRPVQPHCRVERDQQPGDRHQPGRVTVRSRSDQGGPVDGHPEQHRGLRHHGEEQRRRRHWSRGGGCAPGGPDPAVDHRRAGELHL